MIQGKCTNAACVKAQKDELIEVEPHLDFICPECSRDLTFQKPKKPIKIPFAKIFTFLIPILVISGGVWWWLNRPTTLPSPEPVVAQTSPVYTESSSVKALEDSIRYTLNNSRFEDADSLSRVLIDEIMSANQPRESIIPFYNEIKTKADEHYANIIVTDKDCNRYDIPLYFYSCAVILSPNNDETKYVKGRFKECLNFIKTNCGNVKISSGGN